LYFWSLSSFRFFCFFRHAENVFVSYCNSDY